MTGEDMTAEALLRSPSENSAVRLALVVFPFGAGRILDIFVADLAKILCGIGSSVRLITSGCQATPRGIDYCDLRISFPSRNSKKWPIAHGLLQFIRIVATQVKVCRRVSVLRKELDVILFYGNAPYMMFPSIQARILGLRSAIVVTGRASLSYKGAQRKRFIWPLLYIAELIAFHNADRLIVESQSSVESLNLSGFGKKVISGGCRFVDFDRFLANIPYQYRPNVVGYLGRLEEGKGLWTLLNAIKEIAERRPGLRFLICGDGVLRPEIERFITENGLAGLAEMPGWIDHKDVPKLLNSLRLLVLPSSSEGLPTVLLESMACGTPVIATPVGGIRDVLIDGVTGFVLTDNSPQELVRCIQRALDDDQMEAVSHNCSSLIRKNYSFAEVVNNWKGIIKDLENL